MDMSIHIQIPCSTLYVFKARLVVKHDRVMVFSCFFLTHAVFDVMFTC